MKKFIGLLVVTLSTFGSGLALSADAVLSWTNPVLREDGSALGIGQIKETQIDYGPCTPDDLALASVTGTKAFPGPAATGTIIGIPWGKWCFQARTVSTDLTDNTSRNSGTVWARFVAPPNPPVITTVGKVAYEVLSHPVDGVRLGRAVGTISLGTPCSPEPVVQTFGGTYYAVPYEAVVFSKVSKSATVVALCGPSA